MSQTVRQSVTTATKAEISPKAQKVVGSWLMGCAGMCAGAVILGGITRLEHLLSVSSFYSSINHLAFPLK